MVQLRVAGGAAAAGDTGLERHRERTFRRAAKRIYGVSEFLHYAVADGLGRLFSRHGRWKHEPEPEDQDFNPLGLIFETS